MLAADEEGGDGTTAVLRKGTGVVSFSNSTKGGARSSSDSTTTNNILRAEAPVFRPTISRSTSQHASSAASMMSASATTMKKNKKRGGRNTNKNNILFIILVVFIFVWIGVHEYLLPRLLNGNYNTAFKSPAALFQNLRRRRQKSKPDIVSLDSRHHQFLDHNHEEIVPQLVQHQTVHQQLAPKEQLQEEEEEINPPPNTSAAVLVSANPYEGWQPTIFVDTEADANSNCQTWRTCFAKEHDCPGKCRDGKDDWGTPPVELPAHQFHPNAQWIPDVTVLRRMMVAGHDADGQPWPPPLFLHNIGSEEEEDDRELCEKIGVFGGTTDENMIGITASNIRGYPMVDDNNETKTKKAPRILCMVYTMEQNHHTSIRAIRETWAGGCDGFLAFSTKDDPRIPAISLPHEGPEEYNNMWQKVRSIWRFVGTHYLDDFDFFFQGGEDLYVLPQNLRRYLATAVDDPTRDDFFGGRRFQQSEHVFFNSGGAGYALSQATLKKFVTAGLDHPKCFPHSHTATEDVMIARCLKEVFDIGIVDTRDATGRERFHPFSPGNHYFWTPSKGDWYVLYNKLWPPKLKEECCAPDSVSFHYMKKPAMVRHIHALLYFCDE